MTDSLGGFDPSSSEHLKVSPIEADKKKDFLEIPFKNRFLSSKELTKLTLFLLLQTYIQKLSTKQESPLAKDLFHSLAHIKTLLETLAKEDTSQNYLFANDLSKHWHIILQYTENNSHQRRIPPYLNLIKQWIQTINTFPKTSDHSLGYYLTCFTGEKWLPFPFMDLLYALHEDALLNKKQSTLHIWIKTIDSFLTTPLS